MSDQAPNKQLLHLVLGGELSRIDDVEFKDLSKVDVVGVYFIVHLHRLLDPELPSPSAR